MLNARAAAFRLLAGQYNVLCPAYGVKWGEREACEAWVSKHEHGGSNWAKRWPALRRVLGAATWDVLTLEELEDSIRVDVGSALENMGINLMWFHHPGRDDALGIAYNAAVLSPVAQATRPWPPVDPKATTGRVDLRHLRSGQPVRVLVTHQRGGIAAQLTDLFDFAAADAPPGCVTLIGGDFNEDFGDAAMAICPGYRTLPRGADEPSVSRPLHKQGSGQSSGKGKIDYIFVSVGADVGGPDSGCMPTLSIERDASSREAILCSHAPCEETGEWPSDHGMEALTVTIRWEEVEGREEVECKAWSGR